MDNVVKPSMDAPHKKSWHDLTDRERMVYVAQTLPDAQLDRYTQHLYHPDPPKEP